MKRGKGTMKYLMIKKGQGFFCDAEEKERKIESITKEDILFLLRKATDEGIDFEMDQLSDNDIKNEAGKIIYENIYLKFQELLKNKSAFVEESMKIYKDQLEKYKGSN